MSLPENPTPEPGWAPRLYASLETRPVYGVGPMPAERLVLRPIPGGGRYEVERSITWPAADRRLQPRLGNQRARREVPTRSVDAWIARLHQARIPVLSDPGPVLDAPRWTLCLMLGDISIAYSCSAYPMDDASILAEFGRWLEDHAPEVPPLEPHR